MKCVVEELQFVVKDREMLKPADPDQGSVTRLLKAGLYREWHIITLT